MRAKGFAPGPMIADITPEFKRVVQSLLEFHTDHAIRLMREPSTDSWTEAVEHIEQAVSLVGNFQDVGNDDVHSLYRICERYAGH